MRAHRFTGAQPLVSILTPSFNQAEWLAENLRSVASQTYPAIEHIIMDGGSDDGSVSILEAAGDAVVWRSEPDDGQADAINKAFSASKGEVIGWLNSDDAYFDSRVVADVVAFFETHPDVDVVYGHCLQTTHDGRAIQILWAQPYDSRLMRTVDIITQPAAFMRRSALSEPMLDASFHFALDYELWLRLDAAGARFARIDRLTAIDRHQQDRKSSTIKDVWAADLRRLAEVYDTRLGPEGEADRSAFYRRQRIRGARLVPAVRFARDRTFVTPPAFTKGLLGRQLWVRKRDWPAEYR